MRNLKKMLSLVMALAMVASFMVVGASAAEFTDAKDITNTEAVSMLVELGVIKGRDTGVFDPTGIVTRAEMAKMICVVLNGGSEPQLGNITSNFTDVKGTANAWADPYIAFCAQQGIISGYEDGTFKPGNTVTGTEAAKMLLVAMGYNASIAGFTGGNWDVNVNVFANKNNLYKSMTINPSTGLSRDAAALMIFNALSAKVVNYEYTLAPVNGVLTSIPKLVESDKTLLEDAFKAIKVEGTVVGNEYARLNSNTTNDNKLVIGSAMDAGKTMIAVTNYDDQDTFKDVDTTFSVSTGADVLGREVTLYVKPASTSAKSTVLGNAIVNENNKIVKDYSGDSIKTVADDNDMDIVATTMVATNFAGLTTLTNTAAAANGLAGVEKVLIDNDNDGKIDVVLMNSFVFGKVSAYSTKDDGSITVKGNTKTLTATDKDDVVGFEDVAKNDYVMAQYIGGKLHVNKAETVTGTLEAYKTTSSLTVDGTKYNVSKVDAYTSTSDGISSAVGYGTDDTLDAEATFYLDNYGYVIAAGDVEANAGSYAYIEKIDISTNVSQQAKVVLSDGTTGTYYVSDKSDAGFAAGDICSYTMTSTNEIKLFNKSGNTLDADGVTASFTKGKTAISAASGLSGTYYTTSSTVFYYVSTVNGKTTINTYTGYASAPSIGGGVGVDLLLNGTKVLAVRFTGANIASTDVSENLFVYSWGNTYGKYREANVVLAGSDETKTIEVNVSSSDAGLREDMPYLYTVDKDGYYVLTKMTGTLTDGTSAGLITKATAAAAAHVSASTIVLPFDGTTNAPGTNTNNAEYKIVADTLLIDNSGDPTTPSVSMKNAPGDTDKIKYVLVNGDGEALMIVIDNGKSGGPIVPPVDTYTNVVVNGAAVTLEHYGATAPTLAQQKELIRVTLDAKSVGISGATATVTNNDNSVDTYALTVTQVYKVTFDGKLIGYYDAAATDVVVSDVATTHAIAKAATNGIAAADVLTGGKIATMGANDYDLVTAYKVTFDGTVNSVKVGTNTVNTTEFVAKGTELTIKVDAGTTGHTLKANGSAITPVSTDNAAVTKTHTPTVDVVYAYGA